MVSMTGSCVSHVYFQIHDGEAWNRSETGIASDFQAFSAGGDAVKQMAWSLYQQPWEEEIKMEGKSHRMFKRIQLF